jgi:hypothetical protein
MEIYPLPKSYEGGGAMENQRLANAIQLSRSGRKAEAKQLLESILREDSANALAWLWMSDVVPEDAEKRVCLENVLAIDPENVLARRGLEILEQRSPEISETTESIQPPEVEEQPWEEPISYPEIAEPLPVPEPEISYVEEPISYPETAAPPPDLGIEIEDEEESLVQDTSGEMLRFLPRFLTFIGGLLAGCGVLLVWEEVTIYTEAGVYTTSTSRGLESVQGILVLVGGIILCVISLMHKTKPMRPASPYAFLISIPLLIVTLYKTAVHVATNAEYWALRESAEPFTDFRTGDGLYMSALGLAIAILGATGINPGQGRPDWTTYLAVGFQWLIAFMAGVYGATLRPIFGITFSLPFGIIALISTIAVLYGRRQAILNPELA